MLLRGRMAPGFLLSRYRCLEWHIYTRSAPHACLSKAIRLATETISLNSLHLLGVSILVWDHILTLGDEIRFVWLRNKSTSSIWFLLVRYIGLLGNVPVVIFSFTTVSSAVCVKYTLIHQVILVLTQIIVSLVMIIRTFALYSRNKRVLVFLIVVSACFIGVSVWAEHGQHAIPATALPGCHLGASETTGYHLSASWIALFVFDTLIFALTLHKTVATRRDVGFDAPLPLHMALVRDGALYFAAMAFANLSNIVTEYLTGPLIRGSLSTFANCVSISMMCRLMLNLHRIARWESCPARPQPQHRDGRAVALLSIWIPGKEQRRPTTMRTRGLQV
ncbi:hypothetical protein C8F01DRAFT_1365243 [Mycena amicta]|nr:hypothetical protein C8F01DRAFT_1365243 [Mycena amicta]